MTTEECMHALVNCCITLEYVQNKHNIASAVLVEAINEAQRKVKGH